jgi:uncharacterized protein YecE (DUF72 family)
MATDRSMKQTIANPLLHLGTSAFTADGWAGSFYPQGLAQKDYLSYYATQFDAVEVDSTFYRIPSVSTVKNWYDRTPAGFLFALKAPQEITHERVLLDAGEVFDAFLRATEALVEKRGPILLQFPYFNRNAFAAPADFLARLKPFLEKLPSAPRFALEIRNKNWLGPALYDLLGKHRVALALIDHPWMPRPREWFSRGDAVTTDFTYIRWLGNRKEIEEQTKTWDKTIVDRKSELLEWVEACRAFLKRKISVFAFANNHYAGHGPATVRLFLDLLEKRKS